ncbi:AAA family ATPase [Micromonospora coxensis]|uniref:Predicted kinase n=1 Tax=Micromonospora coxensis TaxID=356852 RepID=A0A1C5J2D4_9ACTN|nr:AAA family ATPase [Micromonospora coxensis]SCG64757.1 Predicted kinase [Micromonospora coxensis]
MNVGFCRFRITREWRNAEDGRWWPRGFERYPFLTTRLLVCQDRRMVTERPVVIAVCGCPGAGKTTIAAATAGRLGIPFLTRDEFKVGLGLSSASVAHDGRVRLGQDFHVAGGPVSRRAEGVMVDAVRLLASSGVSFVVESSVLSDELLAVLPPSTRVLAVHVVAQEAVIGRRLAARAADGGAVDQQLLSLFQRGEMKRSIFAPPAGVDAVVEIDTSDDGTPAVETIMAAVVALLVPSTTGDDSTPSEPATERRPGHPGIRRPGQAVESLRRG